jgi:hypothetical protein
VYNPPDVNVAHNLQYVNRCVGNPQLYVLIQLDIILLSGPGF